MHWPLPLVTIDLQPDQVPVLIQIEYLIETSRSNEFRLAIGELRNFRLRDGAANWGIFFDVTNPNRYVEIFVDESWTEHLRNHERFTVIKKLKIVSYLFILVRKLPWLTIL
jgi:transmembrane secretion effector